MNIRNTVITVLLSIVVLIMLFAIWPQSGIDAPAESGKSYISVKDLGRAGDYAYVVLDQGGEVNATLLAYDGAPLKKVVVLNDSERIGADRFNDLVGQLNQLERYGFNVEVSDKKLLTSGIAVVPTGAIPSYILDDLLYNASSVMVIYIGKTDLVIRNGVKQEDWYSVLDEGQKSRLILINSTPDDFLSNNSSMPNFLLENSWASNKRAAFLLSGQGLKTISFPINDSQYVRLIWQTDGSVGIVDSSMLPPNQASIRSSPGSIFPWEKAELIFTLNKTNGTAIISVLKDGTEEYVTELDRVRDENYFLEYFPPANSKLPKPGDHILKVIDNSGIIGGGVVHVKDLEISYIGSRGYTFLFNVTVDNEPVTNKEADVSLENSSMVKTFYVSDGVLSVPAELDSGINIFKVNIFGTTRKIEVNYEAQNVLDFYLKYGSIGLILVVVVFFWARMSRSPVYTIRIGEVAGEIRKDLRMPVPMAIAAFKSVRKELGVGNSPITVHEFSIALKRHVTEGADVTEGNVEEIMQKLVSKGLLESHRQYYQLKGEGDIKRNALMRRVRDRLIEAGITFKIKGRKFVTEQAEIGFFGEKFSRDAVVVVEDQQELDSIMNNLSQKELAALQVRMANGVLKFVTVDRLDDVL